MDGSVDLGETCSGTHLVRLVDEGVERLARPVDRERLRAAARSTGGEGRASRPHGAEETRSRRPTAGYALWR
eukprot:3504071-Prymnesium_polylepis.1